MDTLAHGFVTHRPGRPPRVRLAVLPPYSSNLNNTERLWKWLREKVILNTYFPKLEAIRQAIARFRDFLATVPLDALSRTRARTFPDLRFLRGDES